MTLPIRSFVGFQLVQAHRAHHKKAEEQLGKLGLRAGQEIILMMLWAEEGLTQARFVEQLGVEQPTISVVLQRMEKAGLLSRHQDSQDGRVWRVYLTAKGQALEEPVMQIWQHLEKQLLNSFTEAEQSLLRRLLMQVQTNFA